MKCKPRHDSLISRFAGVMMCVVILAILFAAYGGMRIFAQAFQSIVQGEAESALAAGEKLLTDYARGERTAEQTAALLNPEVPIGDWKLRLEDARGGIIAQTEGIDALLEQVREEEERRGGASGARKEIRRLTGSTLENLYVRTVSDGERVLGQVTVGRQVKLFTELSFQANGRLVVLLAGLLFVFCVFSWMMGHWVVMPVRKLTRASRALAAGDFTVRANEGALGELGQLSRAFNQMSDELQHTIELLAYEKRSMVRMMDGLSEGILALDEGQNEIHRNAAFERMLAMEPAARVEIEGRVQVALRACMATGGEQTHLIHREGASLQLTVSPIPARGGMAYGAVALLRDVTAQQKLEQTRHDYVANITHELRTPLATMRGLLEPLKDGLVDSESDRQRYYAIVLGEILRLSRLVNDLLELSGLQSGRAGIELERVEVQQLFEELQDRFAQSAASRGITLRVEMPEAPWEVFANEDRLSQVLTILLDNALKYTPGGGAARVWAEPLEDGQTLRIAVSDTGVGIAPEHLPHVFDRFYQTDRSHSEKGNGLGLSIAQEVLEKMRMRLSVRSTVEEGSTFFFDVPLKM